MTKDWDAVQAEIKELSGVQKKRLDEVRKIMETKHGFKASTRAYRMKLAEWGITRGRGVAEGRGSGKDAKNRGVRKGNKRRLMEEEEEEEDDDSDSTVDGFSRGNVARDSGNASGDSESLETMLLGRATVQPGSNDAEMIDQGFNTLEDPTDLTPSRFVRNSDRPINAWDQGGTVPAGVVMRMLAAVLEGDSQKLEALIMQHPKHINFPIGLPFDVPDGRFFNHPAMTNCYILQHPDQTIFDIACGLPSGPVVWVLLSHAAKGSKHPYGTDLALHNAIKNGHTYTVQALLMPGRSNIHGEPETTWKPFLQAVYWNQPNIVRLLIDRGASVNTTSPSVDGVHMSALQYCLERRFKEYLYKPTRDKCETILKMLLNAGADILDTFETFIKPWQGDPDWVAKLNQMEIECLEAFVRKGANLETTFKGFTCGANSCATMQHQILWHATPAIARLLIDHATPSPEGNGSGLLHEIVGSCPDSKRHPSDTLRDIDVLLKRGADPNLSDGSGFTPLRRCIELCPAVDVIPRIRMLLDNGADPEHKHANRLPPYVLAARNFEEPLRSQLMDFLVAKIRGRQHRVVYDETFTWAEGYFPIPDAPTLSQVQVYSGQNGAFNANLSQMVPEDVQNVFRRAAFSVASVNFLNVAVTHAKANFPLSLSFAEKDGIYQAIQQRLMAGLPEYRFDQEFVLGLLKPQMAPVVAQYGVNPTPSLRPHEDEFMLPHQTPILSLAPQAPGMMATSSSTFNNVPQTVAESSSRRSSTSSSDNTSDCFIASTTQIRWPQVGGRTRHGDIKKSKSAVLTDTCKECGNGVMLTAAEVEKHRVEHEHNKQCLDSGCTRRFCGISKRGLIREFTFSPGS